MDYGLSRIPSGRRKARLLPVLGHVAESVTEVILSDLGQHIVWHQIGGGIQGIDLPTLSPSESRLLAVEAKGTLRPGQVPRLSTGKPVQMSTEWLDAVRNVGMVEWELQSDDVYGAMFGLNFADMAYRLAVTDDFLSYQPVNDLHQLQSLNRQDYDLR